MSLEESDQLSYQKILIVDDELYNIEAFKGILETKFEINYTELICDHAMNGREAVNKIIDNVE